MPSGRTRSETSHLAVLDATRALLIELGYERLSFDKIAARAGVGKQTIYRWWPSKGAVVAEAALGGGITPEPEALPDTGDVRTDLRGWLRAWVADVTTVEGAGLILALTAAGADDQEIADRIWQQFSAPHEQRVIDRLVHAQTAGQIRADAHLPTIASTLVGGLLYKVLGRNATPTAEDADRIVDLVLGGAGA